MPRPSPRTNRTRCTLGLTNDCGRSRSTSAGSARTLSTRCTTRCAEPLPSARRAPCWHEAVFREPAHASYLISAISHLVSCIPRTCSCLSSFICHLSPRVLYSANLLMPLISYLPSLTSCPVSLIACLLQILTADVGNVANAQQKILGARVRPRPLRTVAPTHVPTVHSL